MSTLDLSAYSRTGAKGQGILPHFYCRNADFCLLLQVNGEIAKIMK